MTIAFIGLGNMGAPMALNLIKAGHTLMVYDLDEARAASHRAAGAAFAASPREAAEGVEVVITSLARPAAGRGRGPRRRRAARGPTGGRDLDRHHDDGAQADLRAGQ
jgi:glycine/D-amino acid oxidase-like deaminating enzyme